MKTLLKILLGLSLLVNAALALLWLKTDGNAGAESANAQSPRGGGETAAAAPSWEKLKGGELADTVAKLREAGFPPHVVRAIVAAQIRERFAAQRKAIEGDVSQQAFWKVPTMDPNRVAAMRNLNREQEKVLRGLLGADAEEPGASPYLERGLTALPPEKAAAVKDLVRAAEELRQDIYAAANTGTGIIDMTADQRQKISDVTRDLRTQLAKVLTPEELENYELRTSNTASSLRYSLSAFNATEAEFRTIFRIQREFDEANPPVMGMMGPAESAARAAAQKQLTDQVKQALGPERGAVYEKSQDFYYRYANDLVTRLQLPPQTTDQLYALQKEFQDRMRDLRPGSREELVAQRADLQKEAIAKAATVLGSERALGIYRDNFAGAWINSLVPPPMPDRATGSTAPAPVSPPPKS